MTADIDAGGIRVSMRDNEIVRYFVTDHLGSTIKLINAGGTVYSELEVDYQSWGVDDLTPAGYATTFKYTGQRQAEAGLYFYNARWYDPEVGRFIQADSIIPEPGNPLAWNRYAYANNNPLYYTDPSGHSPACMDTECWKKYGEYAKTQSTKPIIASVTDPPDNNNLAESKQPDSNGCPAMASVRENQNDYLDFRDFITTKHPYNEGNQNLWYADNGGGLQPSELAGFATEYFSGNAVRAGNGAELLDLYLAVFFDNTAVVDIGIIKGEPAKLQEGEVQYAHFARVIAVNMTDGTITLANTIDGGTWNIGWDYYYNASSDPEGRGRSPNAEYVNQWLMIIN
jgi:RHS repeat-associated protein